MDAELLHVDVVKGENVYQRRPLREHSVVFFSFILCLYDIIKCNDEVKDLIISFKGDIVEKTI